MKEFFLNQWALGVILIAIFLCFHFWKIRRLKKEREIERKEFKEEIQRLTANVKNINER